MSDTGFTPTTADIRADYYPNAGGGRAEEHAEFDRWLAEHDREVAAKAWERAEFAFERAHNADMLEPWSHMPDNPYRGTPEQEGKSDEHQDAP